MTRIGKGVTFEDIVKYSRERMAEIRLWNPRRFDNEYSRSLKGDRAYDSSLSVVLTQGLVAKTRQ